MWEVPAAQLANGVGFSVGSNASFTITTTVDAPLDGKGRQFSIIGNLKDFELTLLPGAQRVALVLESITFMAASNSKPGLSAHLRWVRFPRPVVVRQ